MSEIQQDEQEQIKQRRSKLNELREQTIAFPTDFRRNVVAGELLAEYGEKSKEELEAEPLRVKIAGRIMTRRVMGVWRIDVPMSATASRAASTSACSCSPRGNCHVLSPKAISQPEFSSF